MLLLVRCNGVLILQGLEPCVKRINKIYHKLRFMFLFPILGVLLAVFLKTMVMNMLFQRAPILFAYGEEIADYMGIWVVAVLCWYQILVILFSSGYNFDFDLVWEGLNLAFLLGGAVLIFLRYNKTKGDRSKWKY